MRRANAELRAYNALFDVLASIGGQVHLAVTPKPHKAMMSPTGALEHERGALGYSQARVAVKLTTSSNPADMPVQTGAHGRTIEEAARSILANHAATKPPLRAALKHAAQRAGIHA